jgi:hypothetical protein
MVFCAVQNLVDLILASEGEHGVRPYANVVGANSMFALPFARKPNGTDPK